MTRCYIKTSQLARVILHRSPIYGGSSLLHAVQMARVYKDSKHFVDMPLLHDAVSILQEFKKLEKVESPVPLDKIRKFVVDHFSPPGTEMEPHRPEDWKPHPAKLEEIKDEKLRNWAFILNRRWLTLCRRVKRDVLDHPSRYSVLYVPYPFIIPGGRFREIYYWDTYYINRGLIACGMLETVKGILINLVDLVRRFGFVPNGTRSYFLSRSQPPLLPSMVLDYYQVSKNIELVSLFLPYLEQEQEYWRANKSMQWTTKDGATFTVYRYSTLQHMPRPESYYEDLELTKDAKEEADRPAIWSELAAACESGWDFSSRWFSRSDRTNQKTIRTSHILPVDLNAYQAMNMNALAELFQAAGELKKANEWREKHKQMLDVLEKVFWSKSNQVWLDIDTELKDHIETYYISNLVPLYCHTEWDETVYEHALQYLKKCEVLNYPGGLPTSLIRSGQQWDFPNGWSPSNHSVIIGLSRSKNELIRNIAFELAKMWIMGNYMAFREDHTMFEKYDVVHQTVGRGGEYEVQEGFGWSNGVILDFLYKFRNELFLELPPSVPSNYLLSLNSSQSSLSDALTSIGRTSPLLSDDCNSEIVRSPVGHMSKTSIQKRVDGAETSEVSSLPHTLLAPPAKYNHRGHSPENTKRSASPENKGKIAQNGSKQLLEAFNKWSITRTKTSTLP